jgi:hypothetical protein
VPIPDEVRIAIKMGLVMVNEATMEYVLFAPPPPETAWELLLFNTFIMQLQAHLELVGYKPIHPILTMSERMN